VFFLPHCHTTKESQCKKDVYLSDHKYEGKDSVFPSMSVTQVSSSSENVRVSKFVAVVDCMSVMIGDSRMVQCI
jgi:hypothetical protein